MKQKIKSKILEILGLKETYPRATNIIYKFTKVFSKTPYKIPFEFDIVMPSKDRPAQLKRTIKYLYRNLKANFNLIIVDNGSEIETVNYLKKIEKRYRNLKVIYLKENLGGSKARDLALEHVKSKYVAFLDNDILIMPYYFENLFLTLLTDKQIAGVQSKVVFPNNLIQINKPTLEIDKEWILYKDEHENLNYNNEETFKEEYIEWMPIGATLWRTETLKKYNLDPEFNTSYEDNDLTFRIRADGFKFKNCPKAICIHFNNQFTPSSNKYTKYLDGRYNIDLVRNSAKKFFQKHKLILAIGKKDKYIKDYLKFKDSEEYKKFLQS